MGRGVMRAGRNSVFASMADSLGGMRDRGEEVIRAARMVEELELASRRRRVHAARERELLVARLPFVDPDLGVVVAFALQPVLAGVVEDLEARQVVVPWLHAGPGQLEVRGELAVVVDHVLARLDLPVRVAGRDVVLVDGSLPLVVEGNLAHLASGRRHEDQRVAAVAVVVRVEDPFLLHQAADEVEIGLAVLHAEFALRAGRELHLLHVGDLVVREHRVDDVGRGHVLVGAAVRAPREEPQPGMDLGAVEEALPLAALLVRGGGDLAAFGEARDEAVEVAHAAGAKRERPGDVLAEDLGRLDVAPPRDELEVELGEAPELLVPRHAPEHEIRAERCGCLQEPGHRDLPRPFS